MSAAKLTPWFKNGVKPARKGVYQQMNGGRNRLGYQRWNGMNWGTWFETAEEAAQSTDRAAACYQSDPWRGLAAKPSAKATGAAS